MNMNFADFYATNIWPVHRKFVKLNKRCSNCIVSETHNQICNISGLCSYCNEYSARQLKSQQLVWDANIVQKLNSDPVVFLLSGGKDSLYTLLRFKKEFPDVTILCFTVNTGFIDQKVFDRCSRICNKLNINYAIWNQSVPDFYSNYQKTFKNLKHQTGCESVDFSDGSMIFSTAETIALNANNATVISGLSIEQCNDIAKIDTYYQKTNNGIGFLYPMMHWQGLTDDVIYWYLKQNGITDNLSPVVSNSELISAISAIDVLNHGYCGFEIELSKRIRSGRTERKPWLHRFEMLEYMSKKGFMNKLIDNTLTKLQLKREDVILNPS